MIALGALPGEWIRLRLRVTAIRRQALQAANNHLSPSVMEMSWAFILKVQRLIANTLSRIWTNDLNHEKFPFLQNLLRLLHQRHE